jgi:competence protein ComEC
MRKVQNLVFKWVTFALSILLVSSLVACNSARPEWSDVVELEDIEFKGISASSSPLAVTGLRILQRERESSSGITYEYTIIGTLKKTGTTPEESYFTFDIILIDEYGRHIKTENISTMPGSTGDSLFTDGSTLHLETKILVFTSDQTPVAVEFAKITEGSKEDFIRYTLDRVFYWIERAESGGDFRASELSNARAHANLVLHFDSDNIEAKALLEQITDMENQEDEDKHEDSEPAPSPEPPLTLEPSSTPEASPVPPPTPSPTPAPIDYFSRDLSVHFLDVGQADSALILLPNGENMLIDGGESTNADTIIRYLRSHDVTTIDYLVATHPHADHIGGLPAIINAFEIHSIFMPRVTHTTQTFERLLTSIQDKGLQIDEAKGGTNILSLPGLEIDIIAPIRFDFTNLNDHSAVIRLVFGNTSFLFMGDAEAASENHITADVSADVLKVGHHGSRTSTSAAFLRRVAPSHAVISVGRNSYGHPTDDVLSRLDDAGVKVYRTDMVGTIIFTSDGESIIVDKSPTPYQPQAPMTDDDDGELGAGGGEAENNSASADIVVFITRTGQRYHNDGCRHLSQSRIETTLSDAKAQGLTACGTCRPPG